eukprot:3555418-Pyramimonas_sp.AAC.2
MPGFFAACEFVAELPVYQPTRGGDPELKLNQTRSVAPTDPDSAPPSNQVVGNTIEKEPEERQFGLLGGAPPKRQPGIEALGRGIVDDLRQ